MPEKNMIFCFVQFVIENDTKIKDFTDYTSDLNEFIRHKLFLFCCNSKQSEKERKKEKTNTKSFDFLKGSTQTTSYSSNHPFRTVYALFVYVVSANLLSL